MAPLGVRVITVHTGTVSTNTLSRGATLKLPDNSRYKSIEKEIVARAKGEDGTPRLEPADYTERVVADILAGNVWQIWRGGYASIVRFTSAWFPTFVSVSAEPVDPPLGHRSSSLNSGLFINQRNWVRYYEGLSHSIINKPHHECYVTRENQEIYLRYIL